MADVTHSLFLDSPPDQNIDHKYLTAREVGSLPAGVFYKKKSELTRHRFVRFELQTPTSRAVAECIDDSGAWRADPTELMRVARALGLEPADTTEAGLLHLLGLESLLLSSTDPLPATRIHLPTSRTDIEMLYRDYTDMVEQGHFDQDSPDLERMEWLVERVPKRSKVLDMGCNSGGFGPPLIAKDCDVHGVDLSPTLVDLARGRGVNAICAWAESTPYDDASFDVVLCAELLEHVLDPSALLLEARRVLRKGGLLTGSVPHGDGPWGHEDIGKHPEHLRAFRATELEDLLSRSGFRLHELSTQYHTSHVPMGLVFAAVR